MDSERRNVRYEIKMDCEQEFLPVTQNWIRLHPAVFNETYPTRQVNNIYFDTPNLDTYYAHIDGARLRRKLRFRWYGLELNEVYGQLELKVKNGRIGWKLVQLVEAKLDLHNSDWIDVQRILEDKIHNIQGTIFSEMLSVARPLVLNSYQREYYLSSDGQIRLTLDYNQKAYNQWLTPFPNLIFRIPTLDRIQIELKCDVENALILADVLAEFPLRATRHSKFISTINASI